MDNEYRRGKRVSSVDLWLTSVSAVALFGLISLWANFARIDTTVVVEMTDGGLNQAASGRVVVVSSSWWGLRRSAVLAEYRPSVDESTGEPRVGNAWTIIDELGGKRRGRRELPGPLYAPIAEAESSYVKMNLPPGAWFVRHPVKTLLERNRGR